MELLCGYGQSDHQFMGDMTGEHDDGSFDQLFEKYRQETEDNEEEFTFVQKEIVKGLLWMRINGAERESSRSRSTSPPRDGISSAQFTHSYGMLPVIPKKKRSGGGSKKEKRVNRKRCFGVEDIDDEQRVRSTSKRRKSESRALDLGFDFSDEIKALLGEDGDKDFKLRIRKKLFQTDTNAHHDRLTMPCRQINELENLLIGAEKRKICHGDGIGVTLVELGLGDEKDSTFISQLRLKQWDMNSSSSFALRSSWNDVMVRNVGVLHQDDYVQIYSFRRNGELWLVLVKDSDHEEGRADGVFGRRTGAQAE
ncbi:hypothetical protein SADUNF_Sadunf13G0053200 [Salix dunnii]|uniref:B3 domain-containing protein n=1 Tax=Salix dunnii TaxID=1413687 RepID=A0A835JJ94_9ROSI|nr:hypothetical protein SADUNF_Sadunf13G0053200 [Salix dunnii]